MIDKKEFLLQSIIKAYIEHSEPIGSSQLKSMYDIAYSPATIRAYFKKLGEEGFLAQEHISSGRTPTTEALKQYWQNRINFNINQEVNLKALEYFASQVGLCVFLRKEKSDILQNIIEIGDKYLLLEFSSFTINVKYSDALCRFLRELLGFEIKDILKISKDVGAYEVYSTLKQESLINDFQIFNYREFLSLALKYDFDELTINKFLKGNILDLVNNGLYFEELLPSEYMAICHRCIIDDEEYKVLVVGELSKDYEYFYKKISDYRG